MKMDGNASNGDSCGDTQQMANDNCAEHSTSTSTLFETCLTSRKRLGLFATEDIKQGTRIIAEDALLVVAADCRDQPVNVPKQFEKLSPSQHDVFTSLPTPRAKRRNEKVFGREIR